MKRLSIFRIERFGNSGPLLAKMGRNLLGSRLILFLRPLERGRRVEGWSYVRASCDREGKGPQSSGRRHKTPVTGLKPRISSARFVNFFAGVRASRGGGSAGHSGIRTRHIVTSWVRPKQDLAVRIEAAFPRDKAGVVYAGIIQGAVPGTPLPPFAPGYVIAVSAVRISRIPGRTKNALAGVAQVPGHCGSAQHRKEDRSSANQFEFCHALLPGFG
jgi:hypothetical protein